MWPASIPHKHLFDMAIAQASGSQPVGREPLGAAVVTRQVSCMLGICIAIQNVEKLQLWSSREMVFMVVGHHHTKELC